MKLLVVGVLLCGSILPAGPASPAGVAIERAQAAIEKEPGNFEHHNALALAFARRARETSNHVWYERAAPPLQKSLELNPDNFGARKLECWILLGQHRFAEALNIAKVLRERNGDDEMMYGLLADAHVQLGNYAEAEDAAQWMLNVGRSSVPGITRAAFLRELFGDIEGSLDLMQQAYRRIAPEETEDRAWTLTHIGHLYALIGKGSEAEMALGEALRLEPGYHYALAALARVRQMEGRYSDAVAHLRDRYTAAPHPENLFELAVAFHKAGREAEAKKAFADFERSALAESENCDNANHELVAYYTDYSGNLGEALRIAKMEFGRRQDIFTLDAQGWALHKSGRSKEALPLIERALAVGAVEPRLLYHAGAVALKGGKPDEAVIYLRKCLEVNRRSEVAAEAERLLSRINKSQGPSKVLPAALVSRQH